MTTVQRWRTACLSALVVAGGLTVGSGRAHAQFPIFRGGEVLAPFGNRNFDGSYKTPRTRTRRVQRPVYTAPIPAQTYVVPSVTTYTYTYPTTRGYVVSQPTYYYYYPQRTYRRMRPLRRW